MDALNVKVNDKIEMSNQVLQVIKISGDKLICRIVDDELIEAKIVATKVIDVNDKFLIQKSLF